MGIAISLILIASGAILAWAVHPAHEGAVDPNTVGVILLVVGLVGLVLDLLLWSSCGWSLVVETARGTLRTTGASEEAPQLAGLVAIDARRGTETLVALPSLAPPTPFAWFGVRGGRIVRFRIRPQTEVGDAFLAGEGFGLAFFSFGCVAHAR